MHVNLCFSFWFKAIRVSYVNQVADPVHVNYDVGGIDNPRRHHLNIHTSFNPHFKTFVRINNCIISLRQLSLYYGILDPLEHLSISVSGEMYEHWPA